MFIKSFFKLFAGTAAVQGITFLFYPVLGRIYSPSEFGVFGFITSLSLVLSILGSGQLHMAFPKLAPNSPDAQGLGELSILFSFISCLISCPIIYLASKFYEFDLTLIWIIPFMAFTLCLNELCKMWLVYERHYGRSSIFVASNRLTSNLLKVFSPQLMGLIKSEIAANFIFSFSVLKSRLGTFRHGFSQIGLYKHYPTFYTFGALSQSLQQELPVFAFRILFSSAQIGVFVMANRFTVQSILLITSSVVLLLANQSSDKMTSQQLRLELTRVLKIGVPLVIVISGVLHLGGIRLFQMFLGGKWGEVGTISSYLIFLTIPKMLFTPLYARFLRFGEVKVISFQRLIQILGALILFYLLKEADFYKILLAYVIYDFVTDIIIVYLSYNYLKKLMDEKNVLPA